MMRLGWPTVVLALVFAGCADEGGGPGDATPSPSPAPVLVVEDAPPTGHPLGITNQTPLVVMAPGSWDVTFEGKGTQQLVLRFAAAMDPRGYSIGGELTLALLPVEFTFGPCAPSDVNLLATGIGGFSATWSNQVPRGDYLLVVDYQGDASGSFTWQVGDSEDEQTLHVEGEPSPWTRKVIEPTMNGGDFEADVPAGLHYLTFTANTGLVTTSSAANEEVAQGGECHAAAEAGSVSPLGSGVRLVLHTQAAAPVRWSGHFESQSAGPGASGPPQARGMVLSPPA